MATLLSRAIMASTIDCFRLAAAVFVHQIRCGFSTKAGSIRPLTMFQRRPRDDFRQLEIARDRRRRDRCRRHRCIDNRRWLWARWRSVVCDDRGRNIPDAGNPRRIMPAKRSPRRPNPQTSQSPPPSSAPARPRVARSPRSMPLSLRRGVITFNCGPSPVTIEVTSTLKFPTKSSSVVDGGNKIILDGGGLVRIMRFDDPGWATNTNSLTLQHLTFINGKSVPTDPNRRQLPRLVRKAGTMVRAARCTCAMVACA